MKRFIALFLSCLLIMSLALTGCGKRDNNPSKPNTPTKSADDNKKTDHAATVTDAPKDTVINVFAPTDEVPKLVKEYKERHPDFKYTIKDFTFSTADVSYQSALDECLAAGGEDAPDIYTAESSFVMKYTKGEQAKCAVPYEELGIDVNNLVKEADIAQYSIDIGTNPEGKIIGLGYQGTGGAFIYRRSIAKSVWGTDDPATIKDKIGPGWDKFFNAAADLKAKGYGILSGDGDLWDCYKYSSDTPWIMNGQLNIDPKRVASFDHFKKLRDKGYSNNTLDWTDEWYADMKGTGKKQILGFFGPAWMINYVIKGHSGGDKIGKGTYGDWAVCEPPVGFFWGGNWVFANKNSNNIDVLGDIIKWMTLDTSNTGLQYLWATGTLDVNSNEKDAVTSGTVMKNSDGKLDILGGQNMLEVFNQAGKLANGKNSTELDESLNTYWLDQVREYASGKKSKEKAIADFKKNVKDNLNISNMSYK